MDASRLAKPVRGTAKRARRAKRARLRSSEYLAWLHTQPCIVPGCRRNDLEAHHERSIGKGDENAVSLCRWHHRSGPLARHTLRSLSAFEREHGIDVAAEIRRLRKGFEDGES